MISTLLSDNLSEIIDCAYNEALTAFKQKETPVGCVIFHSKSKKIISHQHNLVKQTKDTTAHAEILAIRQAENILSVDHLQGYSLYVTLEPCTMCAGAVSWAQIDRLLFGAYNTKAGAIENGIQFFHSQCCSHTPEVIGGINERACADLLQQFFKQLRSKDI